MYTYTKAYIHAASVWEPTWDVASGVSNHVQQSVISECIILIYIYMCVCDFQILNDLICTNDVRIRGFTIVYKDTRPQGFKQGLGKD